MLNTCPIFKREFEDTGRAQTRADCGERCSKRGRDEVAEECKKCNDGDGFLEPGADPEQAKTDVNKQRNTWNVA